MTKKKRERKELRNTYNYKFALLRLSIIGLLLSLFGSVLKLKGEFEKNQRKIKKIRKYPEIIFGLRDKKNKQ
ncbi:MAG: hypothetical protein COZ07_04290 [Candidatus Infernicultor aquiphilus]|uniref:Uncharacterized protein n=1 Tax=Candidatus Infernicultor aquiphilus TaxID=1805029 RepID=A0A2M7PR08_9BACT|nr:MAG: hypothetical protein COZ07_04290 [Candidatus Atribacteria bacterium CG_4_10_14_3_um_filter_34_13]